MCVVGGTGKALLTAADRIVVLRHGSIEATGTLRELLAGGGELSLLWDSQTMTARSNKKTAYRQHIADLGLTRFRPPNRGVCPTLPRLPPQGS